MKPIIGRKDWSNSGLPANYLSCLAFFCSQ
uniref:Uncharacterized protein n=1 Tax=Rhizophora mucronata TaxID=61149 RepID=A0A2P2PQ12_RHIMU